MSKRQSKSAEFIGRFYKRLKHKKLDQSPPPDWVDRAHKSIGQHLGKASHLDRRAESLRSEVKSLAKDLCHSSREERVALLRKERDLLKVLARLRGHLQEASSKIDELMREGEEVSSRHREKLTSYRDEVGREHRTLEYEVNKELRALPRVLRNHV